MFREMVMYARNSAGTPLGAVVFAETNILAEDVPIIAVGWSKAMKCDTFVKKIGKDIAIKRSAKAFKWIGGVADRFESIPFITMDSVEFNNTLSTVPFIFKNDLGLYFTKAKNGLGIEGKALFIVPVIEKFMDFKDYLDGTPKTRTQTRYVKVLY